MKGVHAILTKFRSEATVRIDSDRFDSSYRYGKAWLHILLSSGPVLSTVIAMQSIFFSYGKEDDWFTDREWLNRPSVFEQIWHSYLLWALVSTIVLFFLVGCCCICMNHRDDKVHVSELENR